MTKAVGRLGDDILAQARPPSRAVLWLLFTTSATLGDQYDSFPVER